MKNLIPLTFLSLFLFSTAGFAQSSPPPGYAWTENPNNGHWYALTASAKSWSESRDEADPFPDVELASIQTQTENDWVLSLVPTAPWNSEVWIGLTDKVIDSQWEWSSGEPFYDMSGNPIFANWGTGEPSGGAAEDFATLCISHTSIPAGEWNDDYDSKKYLAVLEWSPSNLPPLAVDDIASVVENGLVTVDVLANDSDPEGELITLISTTTPANGTAVIVNGQVEYAPNLWWFGVDTFEYTIDDTYGNIATALVTITVVENTAPIAVDDLATVEEGAVVTIDVLANDSDPEGDPLTVLSNTNPTFGTAVMVGNQIEYTPSVGWHGTDFFDYEIEDTFGGRDTATVTVTIAEKTRLIIDPIVAGGTATFHIEECEPKSWFFLCWSFTGSGPTTIGGPFNTFDLQLSVPIGSLDPITLNPFGMGQIGPVSAPPHIFPGTQVWFQGVALDISGGAGLVVTNMVPITVQ